jgi:hypothetical protein
VRRLQRGQELRLDAAVVLARVLVDVHVLGVDLVNQLRS